MKTKTFYFVDQKEGTAPQNAAELLNYWRLHFPGIDFKDIKIELGIVSLSSAVSKLPDNPSRQIRMDKNPR